MGVRLPGRPFRGCSLAVLLFGALAPWACRRPGPAFAAPALLSQRAPTHLVVLQHGLSGTAGDLRQLSRELGRRSKGRVLAHLASANVGQNTDGVAAGGRRLAEEVRELVARYPTLTEFSIVGNSLGGLYARFAVGELQRGAEPGLLAGLRPAAFISIGTPHLGVRKFTYLQVPLQLQDLARFVVGRTGEELVLRDADPLLLQMADPKGRFIAALRSFRRRALYANLWGDFMVPFGTAALEASWGAGVDDERNAGRFMGRPGLAGLNQSVLERRCSGVVAGLDVEAVPEAAHQEMAYPSAEAGMAESLEACGWTKFAVAFRSTGTLFPMAHSKIAALRRSGWRRAAFSWIEGGKDGDELMKHMAEQILGA